MSDIPASYELPFVTSPLVNPNAAIRVVDVFVALDRQTNKSRGFGFITLDIIDENSEELFTKIIELLDKMILIGIRGPRELIVKEADPRPEGDDYDPNSTSNGSGNRKPKSRSRNEDSGNSDSDLTLNW
jgi:hypothetical protein